MGCSTVNNKAGKEETELLELWAYCNDIKKKMLEFYNEFTSLKAIVDKMQGQLTILDERSKDAKYETRHWE
jgi:hypothetical protein